MIEPSQRSADEPVDRPHRKRARHRAHAIRLCCARSVAPMVEEIARNLRGLGFTTSVVCGAEARAALLTRRMPLTMPTIHVVCVQGNLQKRVLDPLREALARRTTGDEHLFVALLDVSMPLVMVGQIRRFAEALERTPAPPLRVRERRRWREHFGQRELAESPTQPLAIVPPTSTPQTIARTTGPQAIARTTGPQAIARTTGPQAIVRTSTGPRAIVRATQTARARTLLRGQTGKLHRATAPQAIVDGDRPRSRARIGVAVASSGARMPERGATLRVDTIPADTIDRATADSATPSVDTSITPLAGRGAVRDPLTEAPDLGTSASSDTITDGLTSAGSHTMSAALVRDEPIARRRGLAIVGMLALAVAGSTVAWRVWDSRDDAAATIAEAAPRETPTPANADAQAIHAARTGEAATAVPTAHDDPQHERVADDATRSARAPDESNDEAHDASRSAGASDEADDEARADASSAADPSASVDRDGSATPRDRSPALDALRDAIAHHRVLMTKDFFVTRRRGTATGWYDARARCHDLMIDGVEGWRLPWRRELKTIAAATDLRSGTWWTYSSVDGQRDSAYVLHGSTRELTEQLKQEPTADVLCVKRRDR